MNLLRFFKKDKTPKAVVAAPAKNAVVARPTIEKPASERFGKTVMPNAARVMEADAPVALAPSGFSLGGNGGAALKPIVAKPAPPGERTVALQLTELLPQIPPELLGATQIDPAHRVVFNASDLERGMANGRPAVSLRSIYQQAPTIFTSEVGAEDKREIPLPFGKVLEQFASMQVRDDQEAEVAVPQVETPFLQVTMEDGAKFGTPVPVSRPVVVPPLVAAPPPAAPCSRLPVGEGIDVVRQASAETHASQSEAAAAPAPAVAPRAPIRLSLPIEPAPALAPAPAVAAPNESEQPKIPVPQKISANGAGVPITERVPASSGSPVPTPLPSPLAPFPVATPARIPFKITPPSSDLRSATPPLLQPADSARAPLAFSAGGPRVKLPLRAILRGIPPFQLTGPIETVPEDAKIELPFSIVEPQLSLGRVAISPAQFQAAMPEQYRSLYKLDEGGIPVALPLREVLQNLPSESLQLRGDQEEPEVDDVFETPFSQKAAEDAARLKVPVGSVAKQVANSETAEPEPAPAPIGSVKFSTPPAVKLRPISPLPVPVVPVPTAPAERTPLQVEFDTDETLDAKSVVAHATKLPGIKACAIVFSDGLSLAGNLPPEYEADALCAIAPEILKRVDQQMNGANLGDLRGLTIFCAKAPVSFFARGSICLAALHSTGEITAEIRDRLGRITGELAQMYAQPA